VAWQTGQIFESAAVGCRLVWSGSTVGHPLPQGLGVGLVGT
jgi:hypothetical protein